MQSDIPVGYSTRGFGLALAAGFDDQAIGQSQVQDTNVPFQNTVPSLVVGQAPPGAPGVDFRQANIDVVDESDIPAAIAHANCGLDHGGEVWLRLDERDQIRGVVGGARAGVKLRVVGREIEEARRGRR